MDIDSLKDSALQKEKEWRAIQEQRIETLEITLKQRSNELLQEKEKIKNLKDDFKYNLKLLEERDSELETLEQSLIATRKQVAEKNAEISELKIKIDEFRKHFENDKNSLDECKKHYLNRLNQKQSEIDKYKAIKDNEINKERSEIERYKRDLQRQLQDLQFDLDKQRTELKNEFDEILRKREHEWRMRSDEFDSSLLAKELEIKMLKNELDNSKDTNVNLQSITGDIETTLKSLERKLKEKEWELNDTVAIKDAKLKEIELKYQQLQQSNKMLTDEFSRKHEEMDKALRDKEQKVTNLKDSLTTEEKNRFYLEQQIDEYKNEIKTLKSTLNECENIKETMRSKFDDELNSLKKSMSKEIEIKAKQVVRSDLTFEECKIENQNLKFNLKKVEQELDSFKRELSRISNEKKELNLEWERKYQYLEKIKGNDMDAFNKQLVESRDHALNKIKVLEETLTHKENVIKALQTAEPSLNLAQFESEEFQLKEENEKLKQIIKQMREEMENIASEPLQLIPTKLSENAITKPRISDQGWISNELSTPVVTTNGFQEDMQRQILDLKQKNRNLQIQIDDLVSKQKLPDNISDNTIINSHIKSLNETITTLRKEKVDLTTFCKKQQTRLAHIEKILNEQNEQTRQKQTQIETLKYEMNSQMRRSTGEINNLKQILANLELELSSTRKEADEYHKVAIEKNSDISGLETKISELKMKLSTSGTQLNFGAQEIFIQQLQDEIKRLSTLNQQLQIKARQNYHELLREQQNMNATIQLANSKILKKNNQTIDSTSSNDETTSSSSSNETEFMHGFNKDQSTQLTLNELNSKKEITTLKTKLKTAAKFITQLIQEKEHLIEMSNQLRGELNQIKFDNDNLSVLRLNRDKSNQMLYNDNVSISEMSSIKRNQKSPSRSALDNKLQQLEKKQYELTKKQLAFAQSKTIAKSDPNIFKKAIETNKYKDKDIDSNSMVSNDDAQTLSSSVKSENLKEIWQLLDEKEKETLLKSEDYENDLNDQLNKAMKITSFKSPRKPSSNNVKFSKKENTVTPMNKTSKTNPTLLTPKSARNFNEKPKIRNYNLKD